MNVERSKTNNHHIYLKSLPSGCWNKDAVLICFLLLLASFILLSQIGPQWIFGYEPCRPCPTSLSRTSGSSTEWECNRQRHYSGARTLEGLQPDGFVKRLQIWSSRIYSVNVYHYMNISNAKPLAKSTNSVNQQIDKITCLSLGNAWNNTTKHEAVVNWGRGVCHGIGKSCRDTSSESSSEKGVGEMLQSHPRGFTRKNRCNVPPQAGALPVIN